MAAKPFPTQLLLLRNSIHILLSVEIKTSGTLSPQNLPVKIRRNRKTLVRLQTNSFFQSNTNNEFSSVFVQMCSPQSLIPTVRGLTQQGSFPPVPIPNLDVVVPAEAAFIQIHGGEVQDDLEDRGEVLPLSHALFVCVCVCVCITFSPGVTDILQTQCVYDG